MLEDSQPSQPIRKTFVTSDIPSDTVHTMTPSTSQRIPPRVQSTNKVAHVKLGTQQPQKYPDLTYRNMERQVGPLPGSLGFRGISNSNPMESRNGMGGYRRYKRNRPV
jgi:hypothetical protein